MEKICPTKSWKNNECHYLEALSSSWYRAIVALNNDFSYATYDFYRKKNIKTFFLPITTGSISSPMGLGSDSKPVQVEICGCKTYLADSMQFMLEYGCRLHEKGCFYIMPSFRGENADKRHLCQFYHSEVEIPGKLDDIKQLATEYLQYVTRCLVATDGDIIKKIAGSTSHIDAMLSCKQFPNILYKDALCVLSKFDDCVITDKNGLKYITSKGEQKLIDLYDGFVWLSNIDKKIVPFYQAENTEDNRYANCADLLFGIGEVIGSGERHSNYQDVLRALREHEVSSDEYKWYINLKREYPIQTAGFGMGVERYLLWLLRHDDIRDCQLLLRQNGVVSIP